MTDYHNIYYLLFIIYDLLFSIYYLLFIKNKKIFIKNPAMCQWQDFSIKLKHKLKPCT